MKTRLVFPLLVAALSANSLMAANEPDDRVAAAAQAIIDEALRLGKQGAVQFCAFRNGRCIANVAGGHLTTNAGAAAVTTTTLFPIFSTGKPLLATAVHRAVEQGRMAYDKPLCTWWPELKGQGKEKLTLRETLAYRTGMNGGAPRCYKSERELCDWERTWRLAAAEPVEIEPGTRQRYLPRAYSWMLGHPLEVAMGKPLREVLTEQVLVPAGIADEFYFVADESVFPRIATFYKTPYCEVMNNDWARKGLIPSSWSVASAHAIAKFYNRLCGFDGQPPVLKPETLQEALKVCRHPSDPLPDVKTLNHLGLLVFGMGYGLWGGQNDIGGVFGHGGAGGSEGMCDYRHKLTVGFTCNFEDPYTAKVLRPRLYALVGLRTRYSDDARDIQGIQMNSQKR